MIMADPVPGSTPAQPQAPSTERPRGGPRGYRPRRDQVRDEGGFKETVVAINRVAKVVKGGKRFSFSAIVVIGDGAGTVGYGLGKAKEVQASIQKGNAQARKNLLKFPLVGDTIPHEIMAKYRA